jgi:hypothetical protein
MTTTVFLSGMQRSLKLYQQHLQPLLVKTSMLINSQKLHISERELEIFYQNKEIL